MSPDRSETGVEHTVTMPDGEEVEVEMADAVYPRIAKIESSVDLYIEEGPIRMWKEGPTSLSVGVANRSINPNRSVATLHAPIRFDGDDDVYGEVAFGDIEQVRELRDALNTVLRYRGEGQDDE